jgi:hypothetical protein
MVADVTITSRSGSAGERVGEVAQEEVDVEAGSWGLVDDDLGVLAESYRSCGFEDVGQDETDTHLALPL